MKKTKWVFALARYYFYLVNLNDDCTGAAGKADPISRRLPHRVPEVKIFEFPR